MEESNDRTNKANMVSKPNHFKGKNNNKYFSGNFMGPNKIQKQFKGNKGPCFVCGKPPGIMLGSVGTERTKKLLQ